MMVFALCLKGCKIMSRPSWSDYFMDLAKMIATRATCDRLHVGCVIVSNKNIVLATGYNGSVVGASHCDDVGHLMIDNHCVRTVHAEANAISCAAKYGHALDESIAYVTHEPCLTCFKLLVNSGIRKIYFDQFYNINAYPLIQSGKFDTTNYAVLSILEQLPDGMISFEMIHREDRLAGYANTHPKPGRCPE